VPTLRVARRVPLPVAEVQTVATLRTGDVWLGAPGRFLVVDSLGRVRLQRELPGSPARLLYVRAGRATLAQEPRTLVAFDLDSVAPVARRQASRDAPAAADPRGRWTYTTHAWGSVLGLDSMLVPRWGFPDVGARATALAVSNLADRIYLGVEEGPDLSPSVFVLEAWSGRVMGVWEAGRAPAGLAAGADPTRLYAWDGEGVLALRHSGRTLLPEWRAPLARLRMDTVIAVRPSPGGDRLAVVGRKGETGRLVVLSAATGRDTARWNGSPPDAAWDVRGRLLVPSGGELLWLR